MSHVGGSLSYHGRKKRSLLFETLLFNHLAFSFTFFALNRESEREKGGGGRERERDGEGRCSGQERTE